MRRFAAILLASLAVLWPALPAAQHGAKPEINSPFLVDPDVAQVFEEPQVKARGVKIELEHAVAGKMPLVASPMRFSGTPLEHRLAPPVLGQHTEEILREVLRLNDREIAGLRADGVI